MNNIPNRISLITGSTQGIGLSIAEKLGLKGDIVIISSRKEENSLKAEQILKENNIIYDYFMCDFNYRQQRLKLFEYINNKYGKIDSLVCTVSANPFIGDSLSISENEFDKIFDTNVKNTFFTIIEFLELLKKGDQPNIVILTSYSGFVPFPYIGVYSISKSAVFMMTKLLANEFNKFNIRVNCIAPGFIKTRMTVSKILNKFGENNFLKRMGMPHEISGLACFLCSNESSYINGEVIAVTGGTKGRL
jgi:dehydrogenase/reductase SDR family protein 4